MANDNHHIASQSPVQRFGMVNRIRPEALNRYLELHAAGHPGVRDLLVKYHIRNFSIFLQQIGSDWFEFGYYEYTGDDHAADMAALAAEPRNLAWLRDCDPMQHPLEGAEGWTVMEPIYFNP